MPKIDDVVEVNKRIGIVTGTSQRGWVYVEFQDGIGNNWYSTYEVQFIERKER